MVNLQDNKLARVSTLCSLYFAQGFPWGFMTVALVAYLAKQGLTVADSPRRHIGIFLWSCPVWLLESFMYLLVAYSFHINQQFESLSALIWVMVLLNSTSNLATAIPSTIGGIGPFEIAAQQTLLVFDVSPSIGAIYAAFLHLVALWLPITLIGLLILWHQNWSLKTPRLNRSATKPDHDMEQ